MFNERMMIMAKEHSFDIVSEVNMQEVDNAIVQAVKEIKTRYDFKGSKSSIERTGDEQITLLSDDEYKLESVIDILQMKFIKRGLSQKVMDFGKIEKASGGTVRQVISLVAGISSERAKKITVAIRDSKLKVKAQIQNDQIRVTAKSIDDLQAVIQLVKELDLDFPVQYVNMR
jgi:cyclic-di-GMP-binding protein